MLQCVRGQKEGSFLYNISLTLAITLTPNRAPKPPPLLPYCVFAVIAALRRGNAAAGPPPSLYAIPPFDPLFLPYPCNTNQITSSAAFSRRSSSSPSKTTAPGPSSPASSSRQSCVVRVIHLQ